MLVTRLLATSVRVSVADVPAARLRPPPIELLLVCERLPTTATSLSSRVPANTRMPPPKPAPVVIVPPVIVTPETVRVLPGTLMLMTRLSASPTSDTRRAPAPWMVTVLATDSWPIVT